MVTLINLTQSQCVIMATKLNISSWFDRYMIMEPGGVLELIYLSGAAPDGP